MRTRLSKEVQLILDLKGDFDSLIRDDIMGFDEHPGPFWHYAMSRKVLAAIATGGRVSP